MSDQASTAEKSIEKKIGKGSDNWIKRKAALILAQVETSDDKQYCPSSRRRLNRVQSGVSRSNDSYLQILKTRSEGETNQRINYLNQNSQNSNRSYRRIDQTENQDTSINTTQENKLQRSQSTHQLKVKSRQSLRQMSGHMGCILSPKQLISPHQSLQLKSPQKTPNILQRSQSSFVSRNKQAIKQRHIYGQNIVVTKPSDTLQQYDEKIDQIKQEMLELKQDIIRQKSQEKTQSQEIISVQEPELKRPVKCKSNPEMFKLAQQIQLQKKNIQIQSQPMICSPKPKTNIQQKKLNTFQELNKWKLILQDKISAIDKIQFKNQQIQQTQYEQIIRRRKFSQNLFNHFC